MDSRACTVVTEVGSERSLIILPEVGGGSGFLNWKGIGFSVEQNYEIIGRGLKFEVLEKQPFWVHGTPLWVLPGQSGNRCQKITGNK